MFGGAKGGYGSHIVIDLAEAPKRRIEWCLSLRHSKEAILKESSNCFCGVLSSEGNCVSELTS